MKELKEMAKFEPVHDSFLKAMHLIKSYIELHSGRLDEKDALFLTFIAKEVVLNLYAEACICSDEEMMSDGEFKKRSNDLYRKAHKEMLKDDIKKNLN